MFNKTPYNSQLIDLLRPMSLEALDEFYLFLKSPIFNRNKRALALFEAIRGKNKKTLPNYDNLDKIKLFKKVYPERKKYNDGTFKNLVSDLKKCLEACISFSIYQQNKALKEQFLLEGLLHLRNHEPFKKQQEKLLNNFENRIKDPETMLWEFRAKRTTYHYDTIHASRNGNSSLQATAEAFDRFYISTKLKYLLAKYSWENITAERWDAWLETELLQFLAKDNIKAIFETVPIIQLYHQLVLLLQSNNQVEQFDDIVNYLKKYEQDFSTTECRQGFAVLLNYTRWQINDGKVAFVQKAFDLYLYLLGKNILLVNGYLSPHHSFIITEYSVQCEPVPFFKTERFLKQYEPKIDNRYREKVMPANRAVVHLARKEYDKALDLLNKLYQKEAGFFDFYYNLMYRTLRVKIFYEQYNLRQLEPEIERFKQYLMYHTKDISAFIVTTNRNFLNVIEKFIRRKESDTFRDEKAILKAEIQQSNAIVEKIWLLKQVQLSRVK